MPLITKRDAVLGGLLSILSAPICAICRAEAEVSGCVLPGEVAQSYLGTVSGSRVSEDDMISRSGNRDFDYALAQTLSKLTDLFGVLPGFAYVRRTNSRNAWATAAALLGRPDGTVLFGRDLLFEMLGYKYSPDAAISAVCAHEFGHIVQFKNRISVNVGGTVKRSELHADFLAGYFAGRRKLERADFPAAVFATTYEQLGDYAFTRPDHHGTPDERAQAIVRGFEVAYKERQGAAEAVAIGVSYVSQL
jgi:hypothetical protein